MTDIDIPTGYGVPLVDMATKLFPEPTMDALGTTFAPVTALPRGGKVILLGDSLVATNELITTEILRSDSTPANMAFASGGKLWYPRSAGVAGNTMGDMLTRFPADVAAHNPDICVIAGGTNDARTGVSLNTFKANTQAIAAACVEAGIFPAIRTVPPCYDPAGVGGDTAVRTRIATYNAWIREWAPAQGIPVIDVFSEFVNSADGHIRSPYQYGDFIHFTTEGYVKQGQMIAAALAPYLGAALPYVATDAGDPTDLLGGVGLFLGTPSGGLPAGWSTGDTGHVTFTTATSSDGFGKELSVTAVGDVGYQVMAYRWVTSGYTVGQVLEIGGIMGSVAPGHTAALQIVFQGAPAFPTAITRQISVALANGTFLERFTVPAGTTDFLVKLLAGPGVGTSKFRRLRIRNLTALGIV